MNEIVLAAEQMNRALDELLALGIATSHTSTICGPLTIYLHKGIYKVAEAVGQDVRIEKTFPTSPEAARVRYRGVCFVQYPKEIRKEYE